MSNELPSWSIHGLSRRGNPVHVVVRAESYAQACARARGPQHQLAQLYSVSLIDEDPEAMRQQAIAALKNA